MIFKTDQEPAIVALRERVIEALGPKVEVLSEEWPVGDHQTNGEIENAVKELEKQVRILKIALERELQLVIKGDYPNARLDSTACRFPPQSFSGVRRRKGHVRTSTGKGVS